MWYTLLVGCRIPRPPLFQSASVLQHRGGFFAPNDYLVIDSIAQKSGFVNMFFENSIDKSINADYNITKQCRREVWRMKLFNNIKRSEWVNEPFLSKKSENEKLRDALERYKLQNQLLWQLLDKHHIEVPEAVLNYADIELEGKEAYIYDELEVLQTQLQHLMAMMIQIRFDCLPDSQVEPEQNEK